MVRDVFDTKAVAGLKGWMGVGHGMYSPQKVAGWTQGFRADVIPARSDSEVPHRGVFCSFRGTAVLRQQSLRDRLCPRELGHVFRCRLNLGL